MLQFRAEAFNLTNAPVFDTPGVDVKSRTFGVVTADGLQPEAEGIATGLKADVLDRPRKRKVSALY
jgi:hypothetical protein